MKQVIARIRKNGRTLATAYFYSKCQYESDIIDFAKQLKAGQEIQISFGRMYITFFEYEEIMEYAKEYNETFEEMLYDLLIDNDSIIYHLKNYLPRY